MGPLMPAVVPDVREAILDRVAAIVLTVPGFVTSVRNRGLRKTESRPACILLDGDETAKLVHEVRGRASRMTPQVMTMRPELFILMPEDRPTNVGIGEDLNAKRVALIAAMADDEALAVLLGSNGGVVYNGCVTDLKSGSAVTGQMRLDFAYTYTFIPTTA